MSKSITIQRESWLKINNEVEQLRAEVRELRAYRDAVETYFHETIAKRNETLNKLDDIDQRLNTLSGSPKPNPDDPHGVYDPRPGHD